MAIIYFIITWGIFEGDEEVSEEHVERTDVIIELYEGNTNNDQELAEYLREDDLILEMEMLDEDVDDLGRRQRRFHYQQNDDSSQISQNREELNGYRYFLIEDLDIFNEELDDELHDDLEEFFVSTYFDFEISEFREGIARQNKTTTVPLFLKK